ncbi:uncharacterized protein EV422DRAFT_33404 [Fimicolochytrium jonesii]|uniref:uncharacterized protein n=1 Tax=Fimicolochytrium jonesii TaxID=1396493 RepID=UPI0022FEB9EF|nr:uncharacterized protein EV422DRAFT_33404 [Fimicolochytrium jonesii]KAI8827246.1 hypothetical protein EV422DRAFT_33404 [Fimicolochytrium jonesii]
MAADAVTVFVAIVVFVFFVKYVVFGGPSHPPSTDGSSYTSASSQRTFGRHRVPAASIDTVQSMFPAFPRSTIEQDLSRTGSVEVTCENILSGRLVAPPQPLPSQQRPATAPAGSSGAKNGSVSPLAALIRDESVPVSEPKKVWDATPEGRESNLRARKEFMVQQAREKLLAKQRQQAST